MLEEEIDSMLNGVCADPELDRYSFRNGALDLYEDEGAFTFCQGWNNYENKIKGKWIATLDAQENPDNCNGLQNEDRHGVCHSIGYTNQTYWECEWGYDGDMCEERIEFNSTISDGLDILTKQLDFYNSWTKILEILKTKGSIEDLINFTKLLKQAEDLIQSYGNFFPTEMTYSFRNAGYGYRIAGFENENIDQMKLLKNNLSSEMVKENRIISPKISPHCDSVVILLVSYYMLQ